MRTLALASCLMIALATACGGAAHVVKAPFVPFAATAPVFHPGAKLVVVGDLQRTAPILEVGRESNDAERARIVAGITEAKPDLIGLTGDCVFDGASDEQWDAFDALTAPWKRANTSVFAAFGNHEYWEGLDKAEQHVFPRFPMMREHHWYTVSLGPLEIVVLDGNASRLGDKEWAKQRAWYTTVLAAAERTPTVRGILVMVHQPAITNSTVTGDEPVIERDVVAPLLKKVKTLALLSGHVHSYERFEREGEGGKKMLIVSGGGGGPRAELATGEKRRHPDDLVTGPALRDFHFTVYELGENGIEATVRGLPKGGTELHDVDHFVLPWR